MNTYLLIYDGFAQFEIIFTCLFMKRMGEVKVVALEEKEVVSVEGLITKPNLLLKEVDISDVDLLVIPGGDVRKIYDKREYGGYRHGSQGANPSTSYMLRNVGFLDDGRRVLPF